MAKGLKTGGRAKGVGNRNSKELRERLKLFLDDNFEEIQTEFKSLDALQKITFYEKLIKYIVPTLKAVEFKAEAEADESLRYDLMQKSELLFVVELNKKYSQKNNPTPKDLSNISDENLQILTNYFDNN